MFIHIKHVNKNVYSADKLGIQKSVLNNSFIPNDNGTQNSLVYKKCYLVLMNE